MKKRISQAIVVVDKTWLFKNLRKLRVEITWRTVNTWWSAETLDQRWGRKHRRANCLQQTLESGASKLYTPSAPSRRLRAGNNTIMMSTRALGLGSTLRKAAFSPNFGKSALIMEELFCVSSTQPGCFAEHSREAVGAILLTCANVADDPWV